jgi:small subunit ribosomal protein S17
MATAAAPKQTVSDRGARNVEVGIVISDVRQKTITVEVRHLIKHARYGKYIYRSTHLHAHDEKNEAKKGDRVEVIETRPLSKQKRWRLVKILERAAVLGALDVKEVEVAPTKKEAPKPAAAPAPAGEAKA